MGTISKALKLLNFFSEDTPEIGLMDFKKLSGQDKATTHRHLTELAANGFIEQNPETRKYRLGAAVLRLSAVRERTFPARRIVSQWTKVLAEEIGELVHASLIQGSTVSPLCFHDGAKGATRIHFSEAEILPMHATASGLAALAFGPSGLLEKITSAELQPYTKKTPTDPVSIEHMVEETRANGYAFSDQAYEDEVTSVAVPFYENRPTASGTIAVAIPNSRISTTDIDAVVRHLWRVSAAISDELGGALPPQLKEFLTKAA